MGLVSNDDTCDARDLSSSLVQLKDSVRNLIDRLSPILINEEDKGEFSMRTGNNDTCDAREETNEIPKSLDNLSSSLVQLKDSVRNLIDRLSPTLINEEDKKETKLSKYSSETKLANAIDIYSNDIHALNEYVENTFKRCQL